MKKITAVMFACLMLAAFSNAAVIVTKDGKQQTLKNNAVVNVNGATETTIDYNGLKIVVPQGVKAIIGKDTDGNIVIKGDRFENVKISNLTLNSSDSTSITVNPKTLLLTVNSGSSVNITNVSGKTTTMKAGQSAALVSYPKKETAQPAKEEKKVKENKAKEDKAKAKSEKKAAAVNNTAASSDDTVADMPAFVLPSNESAANEQAVQNVEETLSASAPGKN